ncbi:hypothetical protein [Corynebacterium glutamicum]|uniref:Uncharacterized protein n=1 Tax=Corynebacterium glutamicum (strain R) TaxID=340322 RepID=A0AB72VF76_CORGB|nr:hypothetical protein [Corynebacterium glutamicum]BAF56024.1 hypothetical protein cgR_p0011 [Corynebacterium glutamicum R]
MSTTFINLGSYVIDFDSLILDPEHDFKNLSEAQRSQMDQEFQAAWKTAVDEILAPIGGEIHLHTSEITAPLKSAGMLTDEMLEQISQVDPDPEGELWDKWEAINDAQA